MATKKKDYEERKKNLVKGRDDDFGGFLFTAAERKEIDAIKKKAYAEAAKKKKTQKKK